MSDKTSLTFMLMEVVQLPESRLGRVTGLLVTIGEVISLFLLLLIGTLADRFGRRQLFALAFLGMGTTYWLLTFATTLFETVTYRLLFTAATCILNTTLALILVDYPEEESRGKWIGFNAVLRISNVDLSIAETVTASEACAIACSTTAASARER